MRKEQESTLICRLERELCRSITSGVYPSGTKLPGSTKLAAEFGVARGTVDAAIEQLVQRRYLERRSRSGTYVLDRKMRILFLWTHAQVVLTPTNLNENMAINQLLLHGLYVESALQRAEVTCEYVLGTAAQEWPESRFRRVAEDFDGVVERGGDEDTLKTLRKHGVPCVACAHKYLSVPGFPSVAADPDDAFRALVVRIGKRGYRRVIILAADVESFNPGRSNLLKINRFCEFAKEHGIGTVERVFSKTLDCGLFKRLTSTDAVFCSFTDWIPVIYAYCRQEKLVIGRHFGLFGYGSGVTFSNLHPEVVHGQIDFCEMGRQLCRSICELIVTGSAQNVLIPSHIKEGKSL